MQAIRTYHICFKAVPQLTLCKVVQYGLLHFGLIWPLISTTSLTSFDKQVISARERALCQLTVCFEFQSERRTQKLCPANSIQKESNKETVEV